MASNIVVIDGNYLEGGGQILRNATALSCILQTPITVHSIRAKRSKPGLRPQHLSGVQLVRDLCGGQLQGGVIGSTEITFHPNQIQAGNFTADTHTAGSTCLLMQVALPCLLYASGPTKLVLRGGTNADMAPQIDYLTWVFKPMAEKFGIKFECNIKIRGYYPKGGGEIEILCQPIKEICACDITDFGQITQITGRAFVAGVLPDKMSRLMAQHAQDTVKKYYKSPIHIDALKEPRPVAVGNGSGIIVMAETSTGCRLAGTALGKRGVSPEEVGQIAGKQLLSALSSGGCVDEFLQDQLIILMALANGKSRVECGPISQHTQTAIHVAESLTQAKFRIEQVTEDLNIIECVGIGFRNQHI